MRLRMRLLHARLLFAFFLLSPICFANSTCLDNLDRRNAGNQLWLNSCDITDNDISKVVTYLGRHPEVYVLWADDNKISDAGAKQLSLLSLLMLSLNQNDIGSEGAVALAKNTFINVLTLNDNHIGNEGAKALAKNTVLSTLSVAGNHINDDGVIEIAQNNHIT